MLLSLGEELSESGAAYDGIERMRIFLVSPYTIENFAKIHEVRAELFKKEHYLASTLVIVHQLARKGAMLEIDCDTVVIKAKG